MTGDSEHIELLHRGPRFWNAWRAENPSIVPNLIGIALSIGDRQIGRISGGPINLAHARLRHAFLRFATLTGANLEGADLADTDLRESRLEGANLAGADLSDADLAGADLAEANLTGANLCGANLSGVRNVTTAQLHAAEGDKTTLLPANVERPLIWTVAQTEGAAPGDERPAPRLAPRIETARIGETRAEHTHAEVPHAEVPRPQAQRTKAPRAEDPPSRHTTWLVGGPHGLGRPRGTSAP